MFIGGFRADVIPRRMTPDAVAQVTRHDIGDKSEVGTISEAFPHLIFEGFTSPLGLRTANILRHLFPVPKDDSKRVLTFANVKVRRLNQSHAASCAYNLRPATPNAMQSCWIATSLGPPNLCRTTYHLGITPMSSRQA